METLNIKCKHMVSIAGGMGIQQQVIFEPTAETTKAVRTAVREGKESLFHIHVEDVTGKHETKRLHAIVTGQESHGTIILTTREI